jgi:hypothetical protein
MLVKRGIHTGDVALQCPQDDVLVNQKSPGVKRTKQRLVSNLASAGHRGPLGNPDEP